MPKRTYDVDAQDAARAEEICRLLGTDLSLVINMLVKQVIYQNGIPFQLFVPWEVPLHGGEMPEHRAVQHESHEGPRYTGVPDTDYLQERASEPYAGGAMEIPRWEDRQASADTDEEEDSFYEEDEAASDTEIAGAGTQAEENASSPDVGNASGEDAEVIDFSEFEDVGIESEEGEVEIGSDTSPEDIPTDRPVTQIQEETEEDDSTPDPGVYEIPEESYDSPVALPNSGEKEGFFSTGKDLAADNEKAPEKEEDTAAEDAEDVIDAGRDDSRDVDAKEGDADAAYAEDPASEDEEAGANKPVDEDPTDEEEPDGQDDSGEYVSYEPETYDEASSYEPNLDGGEFGEDEEGPEPDIDEPDIEDDGIIPDGEPDVEDISLSEKDLEGAGLSAKDGEEEEAADNEKAASSAGTEGKDAENKDEAPADDGKKPDEEGLDQTDVMPAQEEEEFRATPDDSKYSLAKSDFTFAVSRIKVTNANTGETQYSEIISAPLSTRDGGQDIVASMQLPDGKRDVRTSIGRKKPSVRFTIGGAVIYARAFMENGKYKPEIRMADNAREDGYEFDIQTNIHGKNKGHLILRDIDVELHLLPLNFPQKDKGTLRYMYCIHTPESTMCGSFKDDEKVPFTLGEDTYKLSAKWAKDNENGGIATLYAMVE